MNKQIIIGAAVGIFIGYYFGVKLSTILPFSPAGT